MLYSKLYKITITTYYSMGLLSIGLRIIIPLAVAGGLLFFYMQGLKDVSLEIFDLTRISNINTESFTLHGNFYVKNTDERR